MNLDELPDQDWIRMQPKQSHWWNGFDVARPVLGKECIVTTCCLKTQGYGGVLTMSLKLSVGSLTGGTWPSYIHQFEA